MKKERTPKQTLLKAIILLTITLQVFMLTGCPARPLTDNQKEKKYKRANKAVEHYLEEYDLMTEDFYIVKDSFADTTHYDSSPDNVIVYYKLNSEVHKMKVYVPDKKKYAATVRATDFPKAELTEAIESMKEQIRNDIDESGIFSEGRYEINCIWYVDDRFNDYHYKYGYYNEDDLFEKRFISGVNDNENELFSFLFDSQEIEKMQKNPYGKGFGAEVWLAFLINYYSESDYENPEEVCMFFEDRTGNYIRYWQICHYAEDNSLDLVDEIRARNYAYYDSANGWYICNGAVRTDYIKK